MKKNYEIRIKLSLEELKIIQNKSKQLGLPVSVFLRTLGLKSNIITQ